MNGPADNNGSVRTLLAFTVGLPAFRAASESQFRRAIRDLGEIRSAELLEATHLSGLFRSALFDLGEGLDAPWSAVDVAATCQGVQNELYLKELATIRQRVRPYCGDPVLLKGLAGLGIIYDHSYERRIQDLDLLFDPTDLEAAVRVVVDLGYQGPSPYDLGRELREPSHYQLPPMHRIIPVVVGPEVAMAVDRANATSRYHLKLQRRPEGEWTMRFDLELHHALFIRASGSLQRIATKAMTRHPRIQGYSTLTADLNVIYLAGKFARDLIELREGQAVKLKSLKLLADLVRAVAHFGAADVERCLNLAESWRLDDFYRTAMRTAAPLAMLPNLFRDEDDLLDIFVRELVTVGA